jgi:predicted nuclease with RNAse H fold
MISLGVDLATVSARTWSCAIDWDTDAPHVTELVGGLTDDALVERMADANVVGIDCPLGWPDPFVAAIGAHAAGQPWPGRADADPDRFRRTLCLRRTDIVVHDATGTPPLSVSANLLGATAMRCALLQDALTARGCRIDRSGLVGPLAEVYPRSALHAWGLRWRGYKGAGAAETRRATVDSLIGRSGIAVDADHRARLIEIEAARREGWIHTPSADALGRVSVG